MRSIVDNCDISMEERTPLSIKLIVGFSISGFLFAGYLTAIKLFTGACAVRESCPYFLGWPVCVYGFGMYSILTILSILVIARRINFRTGMLGIASVSFVGILFSGYFSAIQLPALIKNGFAAYTFGAPTCFFGLVVYMLIFAIAVLGIAEQD